MWLSTRRGGRVGCTWRVFLVLVWRNDAVTLERRMSSAASCLNPVGHAPGFRMSLLFKLFGPCGVVGELNALNRYSISLKTT